MYFFVMKFAVEFLLCCVVIFAYIWEVSLSHTMWNLDDLAYEEIPFSSNSGINGCYKNEFTREARMMYKHTFMYMEEFIKFDARFAEAFKFYTHLWSVKNWIIADVSFSTRLLLHHRQPFNMRNIYKLIHVTCLVANFMYTQNQTIFD